MHFSVLKIFKKNCSDLNTLLCFNRTKVHNYKYESFPGNNPGNNLFPGLCLMGVFPIIACSFVSLSFVAPITDVETAAILEDGINNWLSHDQSFRNISTLCSILQTIFQIVCKIFEQNIEKLCNQLILLYFTKCHLSTDFDLKIIVIFLLLSFFTLKWFHWETNVVARWFSVINSRK